MAMPVSHACLNAASFELIVSIALTKPVATPSARTRATAECRAVAVVVGVASQSDEKTRASLGRGRMA